MNTSERFRACLLGLAAGDAVRTTVEFRCRGTFKPLSDRVGGGPFGLAPGQWTDDTSMALSLRYQRDGNPYAGSHDPNTAGSGSQQARR